MPDTFIPTTPANQCPTGKHFFESVQQCLNLQEWSSAYHAAEAAGNTSLMQTLWDESHAGGVDVFGVLGSVGNTPGDLINQFMGGLSVDLVKVGVILFGVVLVLIALASWLGMNEVKIGSVGVPLPKLKG